MAGHTYKFKEKVSYTGSVGYVTYWVETPQTEALLQDNVPTNLPFRLFHKGSFVQQRGLEECGIRRE